MIHLGGQAWAHDALAPLIGDLDLLRPHPENPRNGDVDAIVQSIEHNGYCDPIEYQASTGYILVGNHRYHALLELGATRGPMIRLDLDDAEAVRYMLDNNHTSDLGINDLFQLRKHLERLRERQMLDTSTFTERNLEALRNLEHVRPHYGEHHSWPVLQLQVPPELRAAFYKMTEEAADDRERLELLMRMAGWGGDE